MKKFHRRRAHGRRILLCLLAVALGQDKILGGKTGYTAAAGLCLASLATVQGREYILVTLGAPGSHITEQFNIQDAISVYRKLETKMSAKR